MNMHPLLGTVIAGGRVVGVESYVGPSGSTKLHAVMIRTPKGQFVRVLVNAAGAPIKQEGPEANA